jgi:hypothetical protein
MKRHDSFLAVFAALPLTFHFLFFLHLLFFFTSLPLFLSTPLNYKQVVIQSAAAVRVFVLFATPQAAEAARQGLNNRYFAGRVVIGALYNHDLFLAGNYTA